MGSDFNWFERRFFLLAFLVPIGIAVFTFTELRYLAFGETTEASIVSVEAIEKPLGRDTAVAAHVVKLKYVDPTDNQSEVIVVRMGRMWKPEGRKMSVQYIPGRKETGRLASSQHPWIAVSILAVTVILTLLAIKAGLEANRPIRRRR